MRTCCSDAHSMPRSIGPTRLRRRPLLPPPIIADSKPGLALHSPPLDHRQQRGSETMHLYRDHRCNDLRPEHVGKTVRLSGWLHRKRDFGGLLFLDLRDHYGLTQVVVQPNAPFFESVSRVRLESVLTVTGKVVARESRN